MRMPNKGFQYIGMGVAILFAIILLLDRYYWAEVSIWREDQATNIWLGYTVKIGNIPVGLVSSEDIPNPNGMVLLAVLLSKLPNLLSISFFLGLVQIILLIALSWITFHGNRHYFLLTAIPPLTSVSLRSTSVEYWNQYMITSINIFFMPIADFSYSTTNCPGQMVNFTDQSQMNNGGPIVGWNWNFGDPLSGTANTSVLQNPGHIYLTTGTYTVTLIVANLNNCSDTVWKTIMIYELPVADFRADTACFNSPTSFTDLSIPNAPAIISYSWNFGDGSPLNTQPNPTHIFLNSGTFLVTLIVVNSNGCIDSVVKPVIVHPLPV